MLVGLLLLAYAARAAAASAPEEQHAFEAAARELRQGFYEQAEKDFRAFAGKYPNSARLSEAILGQAQALLKQTNYSGAIQLLTERQSTAGTNADQFNFWRASAQYSKGEYLAAADDYAKLVKEFPSSPYRLEAVIQEASARAQLADWGRVLEMQTNAVWQDALRSNAGNPLVVQGYLLLSEAHLAQKNSGAAEQALQPLSKLMLPPAMAGRWNLLQGRILLAEGRNEDALQRCTNMLTLAAEAAQPVLRADSLAFQAGVLERLGRTDEAIAALTNNLAEGTPAERQRQALLKIIELYLAQANKDAEAMRMLTRFLGQFPSSPAADLAWLTLGELQLRQYVTGSQTNRASTAATNAPAGTNYLQEAQASFQALVQGFPQSRLFGRAQLDLAWCFWRENKWPECEKACHAAIERLPAGAEQATAYFKLADAQFQQKDFTNALANYSAVIEKFTALADVKTNLIEPALYQSVRAALAAGDLNTATNKLGRLVSEFPKGFHTDQAVLFAGQQVSQHGQPAEARKIFADFIAAVPGAALLPEVRLSIARSFEEEEKWPEAVEQYDAWLSSYTNHEALRPAAMYYEARANFLASRETNALSMLTNLVAQFPTNEFTQLAQYRLGDYYFGRGDFQNAENSFQLLFQNWPPSELTYQARMMAGRCAMARVGWTDAITDFTNLTSDVRCPPDLKFQAMFAYGDTLLAFGKENKVDDLRDAVRVFSLLCQLYPTNRQIGLAWGELASCYLQFAQTSRQFGDLTNAANGFEKVIASENADVTARTIAQVGLGVVCEAQADPKPAEEQLPLLKLALGHYLKAFNGGLLRENEKPDLFWTRKAGLEAARLAEKLNQWEPAINLYKALKEQMPASGPFFDNRIRKAQEHLSSDKNSNPGTGSVDTRQAGA